jgi:hypothetical protein
MEEQVMHAFMKKLKQYRHIINRQQVRALRGQALAGDIKWANKGLQNILKKGTNKSDIFTNAHRGARYANGPDYKAEFAASLKNIYKHVSKRR